MSSVVQPHESVSSSIFKASTFERVLWSLAGAHTRLLEHPDCWVERSRYTASGLAVAITVLVATVSMTAALSSALHDLGPIAHVAGGVLWGSVVLCIDRLLLLNLYKLSTGKLAMSPWAVAVRMGGAILVSFAVGGAAELGIFKHEIDVQISVDHDRDLAAHELRLDSRYKRLGQIDAEIAKLDEQVRAAAHAADAADAASVSEADGTGGSRSHGAGEVYEIKKALASRLKLQAENVRKHGDAVRLGLIQEAAPLKVARAREEAVFQGRVSAADQFLARRAALARLEADPVNGTAVKNTGLLIMLMSLFIELMPLITKITAPFGPYDAAYKAEKDGAAARFRTREAIAIERAAADLRQETTMHDAIDIVSSNIFAAAISEAANSERAQQARSAIIDEIVVRMVQTMRSYSSRIFDNAFDEDVAHAARSCRTQTVDDIAAATAARNDAFGRVDTAVRNARENIWSTN